MEPVHIVGATTLLFLLLLAAASQLSDATICVCVFAPQEYRAGAIDE
jgi:hypothetical protein